MSVFWERDEANWARHEAKEADRVGCGPGRHDMRRNGNGGGTCAACGESVAAAEL